MVEARMDPVRERYIHLIYLAILFMQPALEPGGPMDWLLAAALAAAFAVWYLTMPVMKSWYPWLAVAVAFAASFVNSGASVFYVYAGFMFGSLTTGRRLWRTLAAVMAIVALQGAIIYFMYDSFFATFSHLISLVMLLFAGVVSIGEFERSEVNRRLRQANEQIATVSKIAERERIARDMHDVLGHTLSVVVLKSELAGRLFRDDPERAASEIRDVEKLARDALKEVRTSISGYRERGFQGELANVRLALEAADIELTENIEDIALETEVEQVLAVGGVERIMLDNFSPEHVRDAVELINGRFVTEASGGITADNIRDYAMAGVDFISVGALTHSVKSLDMSLKARLVD